jgi:opacity protein-like surface antigen
MNTKLRIIMALGLSVMLFSSASYSQSNLGFNGVGARVGFVMPEDPIDNTLGLGLNADLGTIIPNLALNAYIDYWSKTYAESNTYEASFSVLGFAAVAKYFFPSSGNIKPYAGGGLGLNISSVESKYTGPSIGGGLFDTSDFESSSSETDLAIQFLGGVSMPLSPNMDGFAEAKYSLDGADYLGIYVGINYKLK